MNYRVGLDIGSTTAKIVVINEAGELVCSDYRRHNTHVNEVLTEIMEALRPQLADASLQLCLTGSVGMALAEQLDARFVQEVAAASAYVKSQHPEVKTLIDIGGEDSKVICINDGHIDLRMNGNCAGGTGAFIDQMSALLGISNQQLNQLAEQSHAVHPIAARCGVFAKTDVQNLISRNVPREEIAASIFHAIAVQTITTLAHGVIFQPPMLLCGGPFTFLPALRSAFAHYLKCQASDLLCGEKNMLIPAYGCALSITEEQPMVTFAWLMQQLTQVRAPQAKNALQPLFTSEQEHEEWTAQKGAARLEVVPMRSTGSAQVHGKEQVCLGIDSGSTTTKVIAVRPSGEIIFTHYCPSHGNPIKAVADSLQLLKKEAGRQGAEVEVLRSCCTGYGEDLIQSAFNLEDGIIETLAHYRAAVKLSPDVSFILDIGGQDMKAIYVENGIVTRIEINEACSSGCGTFIQTFAESLGYTLQEFAQMACYSQHPCDLGSRCTVFMNSKIKQVLRQGVSTPDIAAGLAYSVVNNCLYKVLKLQGMSELGCNIVVQGGTMRNDAVVRALEIVSGRNVVRCSMPEIMGAYGCALYAAEREVGTVRQIDDIIAASASYTTDDLHCHGCENQCHVTRYHFGPRTYFSGNKCESVFTNKGRHTAAGENIFPYKYHMLFDRESRPVPVRIGIPRILNMYENYPFWHTLLTEAGFEVVLSAASQVARYEQCLYAVMSDNICFPAKLAHSHIADLQQRKVDRILMPYVVYEQKESETSTNSYNCPIVAGYSDVVRSTMPSEIPLDTPVINFGNQRSLKQQITAYLKELGIRSEVIRRAIDAAITTQQEYADTVGRQARLLLAYARQEGRLSIVLAGRPYHVDPLIQHKISNILAGLGVQVISEDVVRGKDNLADGETNSVRQWSYVNRIMKAANWVALQPDDVQFVQLTSFGCGPDAFIQDEVRDILRRHGKTLTLLKIDDISNVGSLKLRVRSLIDSIRYQQQRQMQANRADHPFLTTRTFTCEDRKRTILVPFISEFISPLLPAIGSLTDYHLVALPPSDAESAKLGLQFSNNEVCYPATLIVGDIIKALRSGQYALDRVAVVMSQTGGQCRATNYAGLIKRAMVQAGFAQVPLVTLGVTTNGTENEQEGFDFPWVRLAGTVLSTLLYADTLSKMYYSAVVRENQPGAAQRLCDEYLALGSKAISTGHSNRLLALVGEAAERFDHITTSQRTIKVGIVGEIFLKFNHFAHQQIVSQIISQGIEVIPPLISNFFLQEFVNIPRNRKLGLSDSRFPLFLVKFIKRLSDKQIQRFNDAASTYRHFTPFADVIRLAEKAEGIVSPAAQFGEGWLLPAEIVELAEAGVHNVISLQPFGCIANHVVAKGVERSLQRRIPHLNLLTLDFDSGVSEVNVTNRLQLFLSTASSISCSCADNPISASY